MYLHVVNLDSILLEIRIYWGLKSVQTNQELILYIGRIDSLCRSQWVHLLLPWWYGQVDYHGYKYSCVIDCVFFEGLALSGMDQAFGAEYVGH